jgi:hypothetical protein
MTHNIAMLVWLRDKSALLGKCDAIRVGPGRGDEQPDPWPVLRGMMRKGQAVHCSGHLDVGEQYVDATGMAPESDQGSFGVLGFYHLETFIEQRLNNNEPDQLFVLGDEDKRLIRHHVHHSKHQQPRARREVSSRLVL